MSVDKALEEALTRLCAVRVRCRACVVCGISFGGCCLVVAVVVARVRALVTGGATTARARTAGMAAEAAEARRPRSACAVGRVPG